MPAKAPRSPARECVRLRRGGRGIAHEPGGSCQAVRLHPGDETSAPRVSRRPVGPFHPGAPDDPLRSTRPNSSRTRRSATSSTFCRASVHAVSGSDARTIPPGKAVSATPCLRKELRSRSAGTLAASPRALISRIPRCRSGWIVIGFSPPRERGPTACACCRAAGQGRRQPTPSRRAARRPRRRP